MTEDDTFDALRRLPFDQVTRLMTTEAQKMTVLESMATFSNIENRNKWFSQYGWTSDEWREEAIKQGILHVKD